MPFYFVKERFESGAKYGKFVNESKIMTPVLGITMLSVARSYSAFRALLGVNQRELY